MPRRSASSKPESSALIGFAGIDVGEDFLDIALLSISKNRIRYERLPLAGLDGDAIGSLAARIANRCPDLNQRWLIRVDSPRAPRDLNYGDGSHRATPPRGREIDSQLRAALITRSIRLSMFPTPVAGYFLAQTEAEGCKPHLRAIYESLYGGLNVAPIPGGGGFTRFMLAGFATYRALESLGLEAYESFPDLEFRLMNNGGIAPKGSRRMALKQRAKIIRSLRRELVVSGPSIMTMDQADAEVLALTAALAMKEGKLLVLANEAEGKFLSCCG